MKVPRGNTRAKDARSRTSQVNPACTSDGRLVVVRTWRADPAALKVAYKRARSLLRVRDPMIAAVLACELREDALGITAEYVPGVTLDRWIEIHGLPEPAAACNLIERLAQSLEALHRRGVAHHALYPAKLLVCEPESDDGPMTAKLLDLAVTGAMRSWPPRLEAAHFVAPEALSNVRAPLHAADSRRRAARHRLPASGGPNGVVDPLMNVYSLGCLLHYLCTGQPPFQSDSIERLRAIHARGASASPRAINPRISSELEATIRQALAFDRRARVASAGALATALSPGYGRPSNSTRRHNSLPPPPPLPRADGHTAARARSSIIPEDRASSVSDALASRERRTQPPAPPAPTVRTEVRRGSVAPPPPPQTGMVAARRSSPPPLPTAQARQPRDSEPVDLLAPAARRTLPPPPPALNAPRDQRSSDASATDALAASSARRKSSAASTVASLLEASEPASWEEALGHARVRESAAVAQVRANERESVTAIRSVGPDPSGRDSSGLESAGGVAAGEQGQRMEPRSQAISDGELDWVLDTMVEELRAPPSELDACQAIELPEDSHEALARALSIEPVAPDCSAIAAFEAEVVESISDAVSARTPDADVTSTAAIAVEDEVASAAADVGGVAGAPADNAEAVQAAIAVTDAAEVAGAEAVEAATAVAEAASVAENEATSAVEAASTVIDAAEATSAEAVEATSAVTDADAAESAAAVETASVITDVAEASNAEAGETASAVFNWVETSSAAAVEASSAATDVGHAVSPLAGAAEAETAFDDASKVRADNNAAEPRAVAGTEPSVVAGGAAAARASARAIDTVVGARALAFERDARVTEAAEARSVSAAAKARAVAEAAARAQAVAPEAASDVAADVAASAVAAAVEPSAVTKAVRNVAPRSKWSSITANGLSPQPVAPKAASSAFASVASDSREATGAVGPTPFMKTDSSWPLRSEPAPSAQALTSAVAAPPRVVSEEFVAERGVQADASDPSATRWTLVGLGTLDGSSHEEVVEPEGADAWTQAVLQARRLSRSSTLPIPPISVGTGSARVRTRSRWATRSRQLLVPLTAAGVLAVIYTTVRWPAGSAREDRYESVIATPLAPERPSSAGGRPTFAPAEPVVNSSPVTLETPVKLAAAPELAPSHEVRQRRKRAAAPETHVAPQPAWPDPEPISLEASTRDLQLSLGPAYDGAQAAKLAPPKPIAATKLSPPAPALAQQASLPRAAKIEQLTLQGPAAATRVRRALERIRPQLTLCYERSAPADARQRLSPVRVELVLNEFGRVRTTDVRGASSLALGECMASASKKLLVGTPDTGKVSISWTTTYGPLLPAAAITTKPPIDRGF